MMRKPLLVFAALAPLLGIALYRYGIVAALAPIFISHMLLLYATLTPNCQWWGRVFRSFATTANQLWLTIDDGPSLAHTAAMLELLDRYNARATFFIIGRNAEAHPHLVTEILARGHSLANHTYSHPSGSFWCAGPRRIAREIDRAAPLLRPTPERPSRFFRAPAGLTNPFVHPALQQRDLHAIGWSIRGYDTVRRSASAVARAIASRARPGAIILLHEGHHLATDPEFHPRCVELVLQQLTASGWSFVIPLPEQLRTTAAGK